jgi:uncharacterized membrane protein
VLEIIPNWHPVLVHFTVAPLTLASLLFVLGKIAPATISWKENCLTVARWNLWIGSILTIGTVLAGWHAFNTVNHDTPSHLAMISHRNFAFPTAGLFIALAIGAFITRKKEPGVLLVAGLIVATLLLFTTGYKGGELVFRHGLGVMSLPQAEKHEHGGQKQHPHEDHDHNEESGEHHHSH